MPIPTAPFYTTHTTAEAKSTTTAGTALSALHHLVAELGSSFCTVPVSLPEAIVQLAVPQLYPEGQQPATGPALAGQRNHPPAHVSVVAAAEPPAGTTTVRPLPETTVDEAAGGQLVVAQSRPVWQQPPPAEARQA